MRKTINATEAARAFSELLNSVKYKGESYTVIRGGKPAAAIVPVEASSSRRTLRELPAILDALPKLGKDAERFARDVAEGIRTQPPAPESTAWE